MPKLKQTQCRSTVYVYFLREGWLPAGTSGSGWKKVTMGDMDIDDPALPADPNFQKRRIVLDLQMIFLALGSQLGDCFVILADDSKTLEDLATWCHENQA